MSIVAWGYTARARQRIWNTRDMSHKNLRGTEVLCGTQTPSDTENLGHDYLRHRGYTTYGKCYGAVRGKADYTDSGAEKETLR